MIRMYFLTFCLLLGSFMLHAQQAPCNDFNDPTNPAGNWAPAPPPNDNVYISFPNSNPIDGTPYLQIGDGSGSSWYQNTSDFKNLGERFQGQCLYFDFYLEKDGGYGAPIYPTIHLSDGVNTITFVSNVGVTPGSGWITVKAPIQLSGGSATPPSNAFGSWQMTGYTPAAFDNVMLNSTTLAISPDYTSSPSEVVYYDNICVKPCEGCNECNSNFKIQTTTSTSGNYTTAQVFLESTNSPSLYKVDWGDGTVTGVLTSHTYTGGGSYKVCVTQYEGDKPKCTTCLVICIPKPIEGVVQKSASNSTFSLKDNTEIARAELSSAPKEYSLVPNPANNYVEIQTRLSKRGMVSVRVLDISGKVVIEKSETIESGRQSMKLNTEKLIQGTYIVEIKSNGKTSSQKLLISK